MMMLRDLYHSLKKNYKMASEIKPISATTGRIPLAKVVPLTTPFSVYVFPTTFCNFKCIYCAHSLGTTGMKNEYGFVKENMTLDTYKRTIQQLCDFPERIKLLSLTGQGEPFLNKNLPEMIRIAKETQKFDRIEIITNGALLTPELSRKIISSGLDTLRISLQGITSEKYREMCGAKIDFNDLLKNIKYLYSIKNEMNLYVKVLDAALDEGDEKKFYELFSNCSDRMFIEKLQPAYSGVEMTEGLVTNHDRYGRKITDRVVCPLPFFMLGIFPNGDVQPCDNLYRPVILGNIHNESIVDMWNGNELKEFWKLQLRGERLKHPKCSLCCAPNDVSQSEDILDDHTDILMEKLI